MNITLKSMKMAYFQGHKHLEINFDPTATNIFGNNATGKTTIVSAFRWCLFGKDVNDRTDFEIKTLDENNKVIPQVDHSVELAFDIDGAPLTIMRIMREKWVRRRGTEIAEFAGNENLFYWNDVPVQLKEFQQRVAQLVDEKLFKLITDPIYFNAILPWQDRRTILFSMADPVTDEMAFNAIATHGNERYLQVLRDHFAQKKSEKDIKAQLSAQKKKLKDELETIPLRVDEATKSIPTDIDYGSIQNQIKTLEGQILEWNQAKNNLVQASAKSNESIMAKQRELNELNQRLNRMEIDLRNERSGAITTWRDKVNQAANAYRSAQSEVESKQHKIDIISRNLDGYNQDLNNLETRLANLRQQWADVNAEQLKEDPASTCCPTCERAYDIEKATEIKSNLQKNHEADKQRRLNDINRSGESMKADKVAIEQKIADLMKKLSSEQSLLVTLNNNLEAATKIHTDLQAQLVQLEATPIDMTPTEEMVALKSQIDSFEIPKGETLDLSEFDNNIRTTQQQINQLSQQLGMKDQAERTKARIAELTDSQQHLAQELAELEGVEFAMQNFEKWKVDTMAEQVNRKFKHIRFKLFEDQINGGTNPICEALVNTNGAWVPYSSANRAGQINAGMDVINAMCAHHNIYAPIFIDNRESVVELAGTASQVVNLIVMDGAKLQVCTPYEAPLIDSLQEA